MTEPQDENLEKDKKRTFVAYDEQNGELIPFGVFKGRVPSQGAKKAVTKYFKERGLTENIPVVIREAGKRTKKGEVQLRMYLGHVEDQFMSPDSPDGISPWQQELAIKADSWIKAEDGSVAMSPFPDGYDSTEDPILQGRRPLFIAKVSFAKYMEFRLLPKGTPLAENLPIPGEKKQKKTRVPKIAETPAPTPVPDSPTEPVPVTA